MTTLTNIENEQLFIDLKPEEASIVEGGYDLWVYRHATYDSRFNVNEPLGKFNFGSSKLSSDANNQISSVYVFAGRWKFSDWSNGLGTSWYVTDPGWHNVPSWINDDISSIRRY